MLRLGVDAIYIMFRVSGIARRAFGRVLDNGDIYFGDLPGIIPPEYYGDMEKVGI